EVSNHRWTFAALLRVAAQGSNTLGSASNVPKNSARQILTKSFSRNVHLPKTGELIVSRSVFRKEAHHKPESWNSKETSSVDETPARSHSSQTLGKTREPARGIFCRLTDDAFILI